MFERLPRAHYGAILADPPWRFRTWDNATAIKRRTSGRLNYRTLTIDRIRKLPVEELAADDCCLFLWITWPNLEEALRVISAWGFVYKTCAFAWTKARAEGDRLIAQMGNGFWTRANSEVCLLATRGNPKRKNRDVRQAIIEPRRQHSRKPDCVHERIERLVDGPYLELFARTRRRGWRTWGNEIDKFAPPMQEAAE